MVSFPRPPWILVLGVLALGSLAAALWPCGDAHDSTAATPGGARQAADPYSSNAAAGGATGLGATRAHESALEGSLRTSTAAPEHESLVLDETVLRVAVVDASGAAVTVGRLSCVSTEGRDPRHEPRALREELVIEGPLTVVRLPATQRLAVLTASAPSHTPGSARIERLRVVDELWKPRGELAIDVRIQLDGALPAPALRGAVRIDGEQRLPRGLDVVWRAADLGSTSVGETGPLQLDAIHGTYSLAPVPRGGAALWVTSDETAPQLVPLPDGAGERDTVLDLDLEGGRTLRLAFVDATTRVPLPGLRFAAHASIAARRAGRQQHYEGQTRSHVADAYGRVELRALPPAGLLTLTECPATQSASSLGDHAPEAWAEFDLGALNAVEYVVAVPGAPATATAFGSLADTRLPSGDELRAPRLQARSPVDGSLREIPLGADGAWSVALRADEAVELALADAGRRLWERIALVPGAGERIGPLAFTPLTVTAVTLRLRGARAGDRVDLWRVEVDEERLARATLVREEQDFELLLDGPATVALRVASLDGRSRQQRLRIDPWRERDVTVDLSEAISTPLELRLDGAPASGGVLLLAALDSRAGLRVGAPLDASGVAAGAPLHAGAWFYRLEEPMHGAAVCGVLEVAPSDLGRPLRIAWSGGAALASARTIELLAVEGRDLSALLPSAWRHFQLPSGGSDARLRLATSCTWTARP